MHTTPQEVQDHFEKKIGECVIATTRTRPDPAAAVTTPEGSSGGVVVPIQRALPLMAGKVATGPFSTRRRSTIAFLFVPEMIIVRISPIARLIRGILRTTRLTAVGLLVARRQHVVTATRVAVTPQGQLAGVCTVEPLKIGTVVPKLHIHRVDTEESLTTRMNKKASMLGTMKVLVLVKTPRRF